MRVDGRVAWTSRSLPVTLRAAAGYPPLTAEASSAWHARTGSQEVPWEQLSGLRRIRRRQGLDQVISEVSSSLDDSVILSLPCTAFCPLLLLMHTTTQQFNLWFSELFIGKGMF